MRRAGDLLYVHNSSISKTEVKCFSETTVNSSQITWRYMTKDNTHQEQREGNTYQRYRLLSSVSGANQISI
jgi:hypothetical protein